MQRGVVSAGSGTAEGPSRCASRNMAQCCLQVCRQTPRGPPRRHKGDAPTYQRSGRTEGRAAWLSGFVGRNDLVVSTFDRGLKANAGRLSLGDRHAGGTNVKFRAGRSADAEMARASHAPVDTEAICTLEAEAVPIIAKRSVARSR